MSACLVCRYGKCMKSNINLKRFHMRTACVSAAMLLMCTLSVCAMSYRDFAVGFGIVRCYTPNPYTVEWNDRDWAYVAAYMMYTADREGMDVEDVLKRLSPSVRVTDEPLEGQKADGADGEAYCLTNYGGGSMRMPWLARALMPKGAEEHLTNYMRLERAEGEGYPEAGVYYSYRLPESGRYINVVHTQAKGNFPEEETERLIQSADDGRVMTEGIKTVILGKPNAGKSSLMNVLLGEERAIVTDIAGTTRDILEENIRLKGISLNIVDTAGIRETEDVVEKIGVDRARQMAGEADLIIYVVDGSCPLDENDREIMEMIRDKKCVVLLNKTDLPQQVTAGEIEAAAGVKVVPVSAKERTGIERLESEIEGMFYHGELDFNDQVYITSARQKAALEETKSSLGMVLQSIEDGMPEDFYSIDLMNAYEQLGTIIGEAVEDDLVNEIFSKFCMGK